MTESIRCAVITVSDRSYNGQRPDLAGPELVKSALNFGWSVKLTKLVPDEIQVISQCLLEIIKSEEVDLILTTGGTGCAPRDVTPEATLAVIERTVPGLAEAMRMNSLQHNAHGMLSRAVAGIAGTTLVINLPGSPQGAAENLMAIAPVIPHAIALIQSRPDVETEHQLKG
ncbi:MAG: molybdenum cofactor biosynthesis protein B [Anaerolineaceae bacterium]